MTHYEYAVRHVIITETEKMIAQMDENGWEFCGIARDSNLITLVFRKENE